MNIELKKVKVAKQFSEETLAYTADVYVNGVLVGYARNEGNGGATYIRPKGVGSLDALDRFVADIPAEDVVISPSGKEIKTFAFKRSTGDYIDSLVFAQQERKDFQRRLKGALLYVNGDGIYRLSLKGMTAGQASTYLRGKGHTHILNEMPEEQALRVWQYYNEGHNPMDVIEGRV